MTRSMARRLIRRACVALVCVGFSPTWASLPPAFQHARQFMQHMKPRASQAMRDLDPQRTFNDFTNHPAASQHYHQAHPDRTNLRQAGADAAQHDPATQSVRASETQRPAVSPDVTNHGMRRARQIVRHADAVARGHSDGQVRCHHVRRCQTRDTRHHCTRPVVKHRTCEERLVVTVHARADHQHRVKHEYWHIRCPEPVRRGQCRPLGQRCLEANTTHQINGWPVHRPCWLKNTRYACGPADAHGPDTCQAYQAQGCTERGTTCVKRVDGQCTQVRVTYACPQRHCHWSTNLVCNEAGGLCMNGHCPHAHSDPNPDFNQAASSLSALKQAADDYNKAHGFKLFRGHALHCRDKAFGFSNCCQDKGWGQDIGLAHCNEEEKRLGQAKAKGRVVYLGRYCSKVKHFIVGKKCIEHKKTYCVFPNKLAYLIQRQGRQQQLHIGFGGKKRPNCRGIRPNELKYLDFSKIDFSSYSDAVKARLKRHDADAMRRRIRRQLNPDSPEAP